MFPLLVIKKSPQYYSSKLHLIIHCHIFENLDHLKDLQKFKKPTNESKRKIRGGITSKLKQLKTYGILYTIVNLPITAGKNSNPSPQKYRDLYVLKFGVIIKCHVMIHL